MLYFSFESAKFSKDVTNETAKRFRQITTQDRRLDYMSAWLINLPILIRYSASVEEDELS